MTSIAILGGTGREGPALALRWARAGYHVIIGSRSTEKAQATAAQINAQLGLDTVLGMQNVDAARRADIAVLTVVHTAHLDALADLKEALRGKIMVDATARVDFRDARPPSGKSAGRQAQELLGPEVRVVAAFQNVPAQALKNLDLEISSDVLVCSDDDEARAEVVKLAEAAGLNAYEAGGLDNGIVVEGITALLIAINRRYKSKTGSLQITGVSK